MVSYERILSGSQLKPSEVAFFAQHSQESLATVLVQYRAEFPHAKRTDRAIEAHLLNSRKAPPAPRPLRKDSPALRSGGGTKAVKLERLNLILTSASGKAWALKAHSVASNYPLTETRTTTFPVPLAQLGERDPLQQATILEVWKEILLDTRSRVPDFESRWAAAGLARTPTEIAADAERLAAWQKAPPLALIRDIKHAFQDQIDRDPDNPVWNVKRLLEMGILGQTDYWVQAADARIAGLAAKEPAEPQPAAPAPVPEQVGIRAVVNDLVLYVTERDGGMWLVVDRDPPDPVTVTPRVQLYICAAKDLGADLFDPCTILGIWVRKLKHAQNGVAAFETAWVKGKVAAKYADLLPMQILPLLERSFLPRQVVAEEILPKIPDDDLPGEDRLFRDAARAAFEIGIYAKMDAAIAEAEEQIRKIQTEREAAEREAAAAPEPPAEPEGAPHYPETFVADYGSVLVRYRAIEVIPKAGCGRDIKGGGQ